MAILCNIEYFASCLMSTLKFDLILFHTLKVGTDPYRVGQVLEIYVYLEIKKYLYKVNIERLIKSQLLLGSGGATSL